MFQRREQFNTFGWHSALARKQRDDEINMEVMNAGRAKFCLSPCGSSEVKAEQAGRMCHSLAPSSSARTWLPVCYIALPEDRSSFCGEPSLNAEQM